MKPKIKAYYAHPWSTEISGESQVFEDQIKQLLPEIDLVNPFKVGDHTANWLKKPSLDVAKGIVRKDLELMFECDIIISLFPNAGIGTPMEFWFFRYQLNRSVYVLTEVVHPWIMALDVRCESTVKSLVQRVKTELKLQ